MVNKGKDLISLTNRAMHEKWILASELTAHEVEQGLTAQGSEKESLSCSQSKGKKDGCHSLSGDCRVLVCSLHLYHKHESFTVSHLSPKDAFSSPVRQVTSLELVCLAVSILEITI